MTNCEIEFIGYNYKRLRVAMTSKIPDSAVILSIMSKSWLTGFCFFHYLAAKLAIQNRAKIRAHVREQILRPESRNSQI